MTDLLEEAQKRLARALEKARAGEDRQLANDVRERGAALANLILGALKMTKTHASDNRAFDRPSEDLEKLLEWLIEQLGVVHLVAVEDQIYVNDVRIRFGGGGGSGKELSGELEQHNVGGVSFHTPLSKDQIRKMVQCFGHKPPEHGRRGTLVKALRATNIAGVELKGIQRFLEAGEGPNETDVAELLARMTIIVQETWDNVHAGRMINSLQLRRVAAELLSVGVERPAFWEDPPHGAAHCQHAVRVCRFSFVLGQALGLSTGSLQDLGVTALVHDVGYAIAGSSKHEISGARVMLRRRGFHSGKIARVRGVLDHHRDFNAPGRKPSTIGRILRIVEDYDHLVAANSSQDAPGQALSSMSTAAGTAYDPDLLQLFINRMGRFPPGTTFDLPDRRRVRSVSLVRDAASFDRPIVKTPQGQLIDLAG